MDFILSYQDTILTHTRRHWLSSVKTRGLRAARRVWQLDPRVRGDRARRTIIILLLTLPRLAPSSPVRANPPPVPQLYWVSQPNSVDRFGGGRSNPVKLNTKLPSSSARLRDFVLSQFHEFTRSAKKGTHRNRLVERLQGGRKKRYITCSCLFRFAPYFSLVILNEKISRFKWIIRKYLLNSSKFYLS